MALKVSGVTIINADRDITVTSDVSMVAATTSANVFITSTGLSGDGYSVDGNKVFATDGIAFGNTIFDNSSFLKFEFSDSEYPGTVSGYASGGISGPTSRLDTIQKFPFSSDTNASDVGELTQNRQAVAGASSSTNGYVTGGLNPALPAFFSEVIDKFPFSVDSSSTDIGELAVSGYFQNGLSSPSNAYIGRGVPSACGASVQKIPFSSDTSATSVASFPDAPSADGFAASTGIHKDIGNGYFNFGRPAVGSTLQKFNFTSDTFQGAVSFSFTPAPAGRYAGSSHQSSTHGYYAGGKIPGSPRSTQIEKFPFASEDSVSDVGDLTQARSRMSSQASTTNGYSSGGYTGPPITNTIDKFPFSSDTNASDVGDLLSNNRGNAGAQV